MHIFRFFFLGGPTPPSQLVPNPFNWSPNTVFYRYLCIGRSNPKNSKNKLHFIFNFASGRTLPTQSTGPQPTQLVPKNSFLQKSLYRSLKSKQFKKLKSIYFRILILAGLSPPVQLVRIDMSRHMDRIETL